MISYVDCLAGESSVPDLTPRCFSPVPESDDGVRLLPRKPAPVQTRAAPIQGRAEGSLRRRLLSARVHHQYAALQSHAPPPPNHSAAWGLDQEVKVDANPEGQHKSLFGANRRTSYINPEPRPGYTRTRPLLTTTTPPLKYQDADLLQTPPPQFKYKPKKRRGWFQRKRKNRDASPSTPLLFHAGDPDRKWSVHYTTQKPLHGLLFLPSTIRGSEEPSSPEPVLSLNQQHGPAAFSSGSSIHQSQRSRGFEWRRRSRKMKSKFRDCFSQSCFWVCLQFSVWTRKSSVDSDDDEQLVVGRTRPMTPLVLTSCWEGPASCVEGGTSCGLPTPEEVTRRHAQTVMADIVPINITGESFDRQASVHRSLSQRDALNRRPSLNRRTRPGLDRDYSQDQVGQDLVQSSAQSPSRTPDQDRDLSQDQKNRTEPRRIRAPRGDLSSLMDTLTSSKRLHPQEVPSSTSCLQSPDSATYRAIYYSPADTQSDCQSLCSSVLEPWRYQALSPSTSLHSAQDSSSVCGEYWSCEPLLCSGSPSHQSLRSESSSTYSNLQNYSQASLNLEENSLCFGQISEQNAASSSLNFHQNSSPSYDSLRSESTSNISQMSLNLEEKIAASSSLNLFQTSPSYSSLRSESPSNVSLNLDRVCSQFQTSLSSSGPVNSAKRLSVSSGSSLSRSISLKKSKRPPAPPVRNESLKRRPKPPRPSLEKRRAEERRRAEGSTPSLENERFAGPIPAEFGDPWVPRMKRRQSGLNCGTTSTFGPKEEEHNTTNTTTQAFCELQRLASPSSGYSSQSNTPLSSPVSPSAPPQKCPSQDSTVSRPKSRSRSGLKPRPPERTTSLLSSLSSSSLSSCASSSETSIKNMPVPPPPPPLPVFNHLLPVSSDQILTASANAPPPNPTPSPPSPPPLPPSFFLPPPPPLPDFNQKRPACSYQSRTSPLKAANFYNPTTSEYSIVSSSSLPSPPPLPQRSSLPPSPPLPPSPQRLPLNHTIHDLPQNLPQNPSKTTNSSFLPSPPPLPSQFSKPPPPPYPQSFNKSKMSPKTSPPKMSAPSSPLVTTQALKNVKLRSIKSQEFTRTNSLPTMDAAKSENANANLEVLRKKANSATSINETPGLQEECQSKESSDGTLGQILSQEQTFLEKDLQEGSNLTNTDFEISEESKMHLSAHQTSYKYPNCDNIKLSDDLTSAESSLQEQFDENFEEDSKIIVFIPNVTKENSGLELPEDSKVEKLKNEKSEEVYDGANAEGTVISNTCMQENTKVMMRQALNGTKSDVSNPKECWKDTNQGIRLDEIETVLRDLDASVEDSEGEIICQARDIGSTTPGEIVYDAQECNVTEMGQSLDWSGMKSRDSDIFTKTDQGVSESREINEVLLKEKLHKIVAAEICSTDLKIQNAQVTNVKQYKLQTTENYFKTQDEQNLQNFTGNFESFNKKTVFKERNQAYLDMYAMLAESTATRLNKEEELVGNLNSGKRNLLKKRKKSKGKVKYSYYDVNEQDTSEFSDKTTGLNGQDMFEERNFNEVKLESVSDGPWVKMQTCPEDSEVSSAEESQYWSLCREDVKKQLQKGEKVEEKEQRLGSEKDQLIPTKTRSPVKPTLPKKPDLGILGLLNRTAKRDDSLEKMSPEKAQTVSPNQNSHSPRREKPPILLKKPDLATLSQTSPTTSAKTSTKTPELVWRNMEDSTEVWTVRKLENDSTMSKTTVENYDSSVEISSNYSIERCKNQITNTDDFEAILERSAVGFNGFMQNGSTNFSRKTKEHFGMEETARNTFVESTTTTSMCSRMCALENRDQVWSLGHFERFESNNDIVWECMKQENDERILTFENDQNSWMENLENLGSHKNRLTNAEHFGENIKWSRNAESEHEVMEHDRGLTGFCAMENCRSQKNYGCSFGEVPSEQKDVLGIYGQQNVKLQSRIWQKDCAFGTDLRDFQWSESVAEEERVQMKKTQQKKQNQKLFMQKEERFSSSSSLSSSALSSDESETETRLKAVMSEESCHMIGQSCLSLSSALSTDSLKGELSLPDLLIQEPGEEENDVFGGVSADQFTVPTQTRSIDDLFAIIHRSKRKMFGRKDSGVFSASSFSSSSPSPPVTPTDPCPVPRGQRSQHCHSFKILLLKKGVHFGPVSRVSAVERLCRPLRLQGSASCPLQRPLTPPCSASRWFSSRTRLHAAPMAAILEHQEEEGDDDVFEPNEVPLLNMV